MADSKKPKPTDKPIMDVVRPGKTPPPPNSKSVIVANRPLLKDPMVVDRDEGGEEASNSLSKVASKAKKRLLTAPLLETEDSDEDEKVVTDPEVANEAAVAETGNADKPEAKKPPKPLSPVKPTKVVAPINVKADDDKQPATEVEPAPAEEKPAPAAAVEPEPEPEAKPADTPSQVEADETKPPEQSKPTEKPPAPAEEPVAPTETGKDKQPEAEDDKQAKHQAAIEKLVDSKKYYLPINTIEKRRSKHFAIVGILISLLLIVAWADVALDAGLIHVKGIKPVTHFFSN